MRSLSATLTQIGVGIVVAALSIGFLAPATVAANPVNSSVSAINAPHGDPCISPPAGFNPLAASDTQLLSYGLPVRPSASSSLFDQWAMAVTHAKKRGCYQRATSAAQILPHKGSLNGTNGYDWSGWVAKNQTYYAVSGQWTVPCINTSKSPSNSDVGDWVGVGGVNGSLLQTGTYWDRNLRTWKLFYEEVGSGSHTPNGPSEDSNATVSCGQTVFAEADYGQTYVSQSYYFVEDATTGAYYTNHNYFTPAFGTAEWIEEASRCNQFGDWRLLANFGYVFWIYDEAGLSYSTEQPISYWPRVQWYSSADTNPNTITAAAGPLNSNGNGFTDQFYSNGTTVC